MARNWIEFDESPLRAEGPDDMYVSMNQEGNILVNAHAFSEMGSPEAVILLFDPETDTIGLKPASRLMPNSFAVRKKGESGHQRIGAARFATKHNIRLDGTVRFRSPTVEDGILVMSLRETQNIKRRAANPGVVRR